MLAVCTIIIDEKFRATITQESGTHCVFHGCNVTLQMEFLMLNHV